MLVLMVAVYISIHALLAESDLVFADNLMGYLVFLSTLSLRRATTDIVGSVSIM